MKTITDGVRIKRVSNDEARIAVTSEKWRYTPKSVWKAEVRNKGGK